MSKCSGESLDVEARRCQEETGVRIEHVQNERTSLGDL